MVGSQSQHKAHPSTAQMATGGTLGIAVRPQTPIKSMQELDVSCTRNSDLQEKRQAETTKTQKTVTARARNTKKAETPKQQTDVWEKSANRARVTNKKDKKHKTARRLKRTRQFRVHETLTFQRPNGTGVAPEKGPKRRGKRPEGGAWTQGLITFGRGNRK